MPKAPTGVTVFSYQVGFGDCFLVRFKYADRPRHVLIDFGTTGLPESVAKDQLTKIAEDITKKCGGRLEAVVATHRHADHISGFATNKAGTGSGDIIRKLNANVVVQPWTEQLNLKENALGPVGDAKQIASHVHKMSGLHAAAEQTLRMLDGKSLAGIPRAVADRLRFIGEDNVKNLSAVKNLATMGKKQVYAYHGSNSGLASVLPGVKTHVLGPPTLKQNAGIRKQKTRDPDEFWQFTLAALDRDEAMANEEAALFPGRPQLRGSKLPMSMRWFANRVSQARGEQLLSIVTALDDQMNNTSLILLFEVGGKKLLFPGDAQIENWKYTLEFSPKKEACQKLLADVDLYKVGHHGSLNATPRSMWEMFKKKGPKTKKGRMKSVLSTMPGKHGHEKSNTEVPRRTLLSALTNETELHSTHKLPDGALYVEVSL